MYWPIRRGSSQVKRQPIFFIFKTVLFVTKQKKRSYLIKTDEDILHTLCKHKSCDVSVTVTNNHQKKGEEEDECNFRKSTDHFGKFHKELSGFIEFFFVGHCKMIIPFVVFSFSGVEAFASAPSMRWLAFLSLLLGRFPNQ